MRADHLTLTFAAIADPTRRAILARLTKGEAGVLDLAKPFSMTLPAVSKHLRVLEKAGLIQRSRRAQWRPCRLRVKPLKDAATWIDRYRTFWEDSFDRLDNYLKQMQPDSPPPPGATPGMRPAPRAAPRKAAHRASRAPSRKKPRT